MFLCPDLEALVLGRYQLGGCGQARVDCQGGWESKTEGRGQCLHWLHGVLGIGVRSLYLERTPRHPSAPSLSVRLHVSKEMWTQISNDGAKPSASIFGLVVAISRSVLLVQRWRGCPKNRWASVCSPVTRLPF